MIQTLSIKSLYALALAEGEGVGTAYEYFAKRLVLGRWLVGQAKPKSMLMAGLPQKYGSSLDFVQLAEEMGAKLTVVDDRPEALTKFEQSLAEAKKVGWLTAVSPTLQQVTSLAALAELTGETDLALSSETVQRIKPDEQPAYFGRLNDLANRVALFCPNKHNDAHVGISGLGGLTLDQIQRLAQTTANGLRNTDNGTRSPKTGYIDMPPFPPGIERSEEQREQATSGRFEALAMWGLGYYARLEHWLPTAVRRTQSHIVYAFW